MQASPEQLGSVLAREMGTNTGSSTLVMTGIN
jgi:hypothetical protein